MAFGGGASTSDAGSSGLGISYAGISNLVNVDISNNQDISAQNLNANATNKSNIVNVTVGIAGAKKNFSGAGSAGISDIKNDGTINIFNSNVTTNNDFLSSSESKAHIVNVAGQSALSSDFASGLTFAYNAMNNTTGINVSGGNWNVKNFGANSANNNYALAVGAGVAFSKSSTALNGSVGLNMGRNSTKAILDGSTLNGVQNVNVSATDKTSKTTVAGGFTIGLDGLVGAGGQGKVNAAGSTSLNYINNSAKSLAENLNVKANKNFGVVAQSDDKLANYSGTIHIDANGYASIGVSVSKNELTGNTDANIKKMFSQAFK